MKGCRATEGVNMNQKHPEEIIIILITVFSLAMLAYVVQKVFEETFKFI